MYKLDSLPLEICSQTVMDGKNKPIYGVNNDNFELDETTVMHNIYCALSAKYTQLNERNCLKTSPPHLVY